MPAADVPIPPPAAKITNTGYKEIFTGPNGFDRETEEKGNETYAPASYPKYLPTWDPSQKYPPLEPFNHVEHGLDADKTFPDLLPSHVKKEDLTPTIGSVIRGIQISSLDKAGKDQLALLAAQRKVLVFTDQDIASKPIEDAIALGSYYGRQHIMPISGSPEGHPEIHLVHRGAGDMKVQSLLSGRTTSVTWHADVTYEEQPSGTTIMYMLDTPKVGGDTLFSDNVEAYKRLSPEFQKRLHGLKALHSGIEQVESSRSMGGIVRREPVTSIHPIVRTHPATGEKALFVNPQYVRQIIGYKKEESDMLLKFLYDHIAYGADFHARVKWEENALVVFDNRLVNHTGMLDWNTGERRHLARLTPQAEKPYETPFEPAEESLTTESD